MSAAGGSIYDLRPALGRLHVEHDLDLARGDAATALKLWGLFEGSERMCERCGRRGRRCGEVLPRALCTGCGSVWLAVEAEFHARSLRWLYM